MSRTTRIRQQILGAAVVAANTGIHAAVTLPTSGTTNTTTGFTNPDVPRTVRLKGNQATVQGLVVTINGTDIQGNQISENVTMGGDYTVATDSMRAFKTVTSMVFPTRGGASDSISAGPGAALGLDAYCDAYSFHGFAGVSSYTHDAGVISKNKVTLSATLNGSTVQAVNYVPARFPDFE